MVKNVWSSMLRVVALFAFAMSVSAQPAAMRPEIKSGDQWSYQNIDNWTNTVREKYTLEVSAVSDREIRLSRKSETTGATANVTQTLDLNFLTGISGADGAPTQYSPDTGTYSFPLEIGKTWEPKVNFTRSDREGSYQLATTVVGWEKVKVPVGEFQVLKITQDGYYRSTSNRGSATGRMQSTLWYAPAVKGMVKMQYQDASGRGSIYNKFTIELTGYRVD